MVDEHGPLTFEEIREKLHMRGYHKSPISLDGLSERNKNVVVKVLQELLAEQDEEVHVREQLLARNRELEHEIERMKRNMKQGKTAVTSTETKLHTIQSQLERTQTMLAEEQAAHKRAKEQIQLSRKQLQQVKLAATQHRAATDRRAERLKERMASLTQSNLKALVPDIRIASPSFVAQERPAETQSVEEQQCEEADKRNAALVETTQALKQLALDALTTLHEADIRLKKILDVEAEASEPVTRSSFSRSQSRGVVGDLELHQVFPPLRPLVTEDTEDTHPARRFLTALSQALQVHVADLSQWAALRHVQHDQSWEVDAKRRRTDSTSV